MQQVVTGNDKKDFRRTIGSAERRYLTAMSKIRKAGKFNLPKPSQIEVAYHQNEVDRHGFSFFPNHYILDNIVALEEIAASVGKNQ